MDFFDKKCLPYIKCLNKYFKRKFDGYEGLDNVIENWDEYKLLMEHDLLSTDVKISDNASIFNCIKNFSNLSIAERCKLVFIYNDDNVESKFLKELFDKFKQDLSLYMKERQKNMVTSKRKNKCDNDEQPSKKKK